MPKHSHDRPALLIPNRRRGVGLVELVIVIAILAVLFVVMNQAMIGPKGAKATARRQINAINLNGVYQGFFVWANSHDEQYPSTKSMTLMESDTTHQVFKTLIEDGSLAGQQLQSPNEHEDGFEVGYMDSFGPKNTSFALNDYDADNWLRYPNWNSYRNGAFVLLSDRWVDIEGYEFHTINDTYWYALFNDGHGEEIEDGFVNRGRDSLFDKDEDLGKNDALMVHD